MLAAETFARAGYTISTDPGLLDVDMIYRYLSERSYWASGRSRRLVERSIQHSLCFGVYAGSADPLAQIGFARVISDYTTFAYLADLFILPEYQGKGLGKWLVETILNYADLRDVRRWTLYTSDAHELYRRFGFDSEKDPEWFMSRYRKAE